MTHTNAYLQGRIGIGGRLRLLEAVKLDLKDFWGDKTEVVDFLAEIFELGPDAKKALL